MTVKCPDADFGHLFCPLFVVLCNILLSTQARVTARVEMQKTHLRVFPLSHRAVHVKVLTAKATKGLQKPPRDAKATRQGRAKCMICNRQKEILLHVCVAKYSLCSLHVVHALPANSSQ
jgi:hypothetical protein